MRALLPILFVLLNHHEAWAQKKVVFLTPEETARLVLTQSYKVKEVNATADLSRLPYATALGKYDFNLTIDSGYQKNKVQNVVSTVASDQDESYLTTATLVKSLSTGTTIGIEYDHNSYRYNLLPTAPTTALGQYTQNLAGITLTQNLWRNFFGMGDRADIAAAEKTFEAVQVTRIDDLQTLVLTSLQTFWNAYVAEETFQEALNSRDRYQKLVDEVQRKSRYGYSNPGELPQAQAEYEIRMQNVKTSSADYLAALDTLATLLNLPADTEIRFKSIEKIPEPPIRPSIDYHQLRAFRSAELNKDAAQKSYDAAKSRDRADISFVGKLFTSGTDESAQEADNQFFAGTRPRTYVGVHYQYNFGSGFYDEDVLNKKLNMDLNDAKFQRLQRELSDSIINQDRQVQATYSVALSARNQKSLREKSVAELNKGYRNGRTDISILIQEMNKLFDAETAFTRAIGNYQVALNQRAAIRDELIPDQAKDSSPTPVVIPSSDSSESKGH